MISDVYGPVVVGMDGTVEAKRAAAYGAWEAKRRGVPLRLVFARQPTPMWGPAVLIANDYEWEQPWVREILVKAKKEITETHPDVVLQTAAVFGGTAAILVEESKRASLVVLGTRAAGGVVGHLSGSVAAQVAAHSHAPVVVLRPGGVDMDPATSPRPVVVGVDGSSESEDAIGFAVDEAVARGVDLHAVYVWNVPEVRDIGPITPYVFEASAVEAKALRLLTEATEGWSDRYPDLKVVRRVVQGIDPVAALAEVSGGAGLIVVGSRGHGGFLGLRLGSTVDGLIRCADAPIAVVGGRTSDQ